MTRTDGESARTVERLRAVSGELSGAFGDLGTFLPYVIAAVGAGILAPTPVFLGFAAGYFLVAVVYRAPIPVQPMKALGAVIIAGGVSATDTVWAGVIIGAVLLLLAATPALEKATRAIPQSIVTGLQVGLGLMLGAVALELMGQDWGTAIVAIAVLGLSIPWSRGPWALVVVIGAVLLAPAGAPMTGGAVAGAAENSGYAILSGVTAQLPLTLLNAVVVTAAVTRSLFPAEAFRVSERKLAASSGLLNLAFVPLGAMPMCHGAGGLAAHHRFGARGFGAPLVMAAACATAAFLGPEVIDVLASIPPAAVGALLAYAALDLVRSRRLFDSRPDCRPVIGITAVATFLGSPFVGLVAGIVAEMIRVHIQRRRNLGSTGFWRL